MGTTALEFLVEDLYFISMILAVSAIANVYLTARFLINEKGEN